MLKPVSRLILAAALWSLPVGLPAFVAPAALAADVVTAPDNPMAAAISEANASIAKIVAIADKDRTFDNTVGAFDDVLATFEDRVALFIFLSNVHPDAAVREAAEAAEEKIQ